MSKTDKSPIIFYQYFDTTDTDYFARHVRKLFKETGHDREIEFRIWNCYNDLPGYDGDIFSYDCISLSALVDKGFLRELPDIVNKSGVFEWALNTTRYHKKLYGLPFITCFSALICREKDYKPINNIYDIKEPIATPLKSLLPNYYLLSYCNEQREKNDDSRLNEMAVEIVKKIFELMGGNDALDKSRLTNFDGIERFNSGEIKYLIGFSEFLRLLKHDEYVIELANFSKKDQVEVPLFYTDVLSIGKNTKEEKLLDCIDLIEIITSAKFEYEICTAQGILSYMLPINSLAYPKLIEQDSIYQKLFDIVSNENNCVSRFGEDYYEEFPRIERALLKALESETK